MLDQWKRGNPYKTKCSEFVPNENKTCSCGKYNIEGVGPKIASLIDAYFENEGSILDPV